MKLLHITALILCLNIPVAHANDGKISPLNVRATYWVGAIASSHLVATGIVEAWNIRHYNNQLKKTDLTPEQRYNIQYQKDVACVQAAANLTAGGLLGISSIMYKYIMREEWD